MSNDKEPSKVSKGKESNTADDVPKDFRRNSDSLRATPTIVVVKKEQPKTTAKSTVRIVELDESDDADDHCNASAAADPNDEEDDSKSHGLSQIFAKEEAANTAEGSDSPLPTTADEIFSSVQDPVLT